MKSFKELREKTLTPAEKKKREEIAKAIEKDEPDMPMDKKMAIATAQAKKVAESAKLDESPTTSWIVTPITGKPNPKRWVSTEVKAKSATDASKLGAKKMGMKPSDVRAELKFAGDRGRFNESVELNESVISDVKDIVAKKQAKKIQGVMVDLFTASAISQIYDKVNDSNKAKMDKMKITQLANAAMRIMKREEVELDEAFTPKEIKMAIGVASDKRYAKGNMTGAVRSIEKIKKGLSDHPQVQSVLKRQNESLDEAKNYEIKNSKVYISKANFRKVHKDYKNETKGKERMMALDPKTGATTSFPVVFTESVELGESVGDTALAYQTPYGTVTATKRNTKGMRGKQDGYTLTLKTKSGKTVDLGSHPKPTKANVLSIAKNVMQRESVELGEAKDDAEYNDEGGMAISQLKTAKSAVEELMSIIKDDDNLPEWVQSKLTKAVDYMDSVRDYMSSEKSNVQEAAKNALHPSKVEIGDDVSFIHPRTKVRVVGNVTAKFNAVLTVRTVKGKMQIDLTKKGLDAKLVLRDYMS